MGHCAVSVARGAMGRIGQGLVLATQWALHGSPVVPLYLCLWCVCRYTEGLCRYTEGPCVRPDPRPSFSTQNPGAFGSYFLLEPIPAPSGDGPVLVSVPQTPYVAEAGPELLNLLSLPP